MKKAVAATVAFYIAIISIIVGIISYSCGARIIGIKSISFIHFANTLLLISLVCLLYKIFGKIAEK
ncbi:hypothetical protein KAW65_07295 [candidate division WOR-3 bacterium]|nr:hypothetical protein [candidate division WOR-3 bacterium]